MAPASGFAGALATAVLLAIGRWAQLLAIAEQGVQVTDWRQPMNSAGLAPAIAIRQRTVAERRQVGIATMGWQAPELPPKKKLAVAHW